MDSYLKLFRATLHVEKSNSEIDELNFIDKSAIEKVHLGFCKSTLGVKKSSTNLAVRAELGRLPLESFIKTQTSLYLLRLNNDNINPLLKEAFHLSKILDKEGLYSLFTYAKHIVDRIICLLCVYICHYIFPFYYLDIYFYYFFFLKKEKCPNNKKEI